MSRKRMDVNKMADALIEASAQVLTEDELRDEDDDRLLDDEPAEDVATRILEVADILATLPRARRR